MIRMDGIGMSRTTGAGVSGNESKPTVLKKIDKARNIPLNSTAVLANHL